MLVFVMVGLTTLVCNIGQGKCIFIDPQVMTGILAAGVLELMSEAFAGYLKIFRNRNRDE